MSQIEKQYKQTTLFDYFKIDIKKENVVVKKNTSIVGEMLSVLPSDLQNIVFSYDDTYKINYNMVIAEIQQLLSMRNCLEFKKKHWCLGLNSWYSIAHKMGFYHIRVSSIQNEFEGCNSLLLSPYQLMLNMENSIRGNKMIDEFDYDKFFDFQNEIFDFVMQFNESDEDD